jgi:hypothetical protein
MSDPDAAQRVRAEQTAEWTAAAPGWRQRAIQQRNLVGPVTEELLRQARLAAGLRVLDLASGLGDPSLHIARLVAPDARCSGWTSPPRWWPAPRPKPPPRASPT